MKKIVTENNRKKTPEGYKQTEVGIIPEDWSVSSLGELAEKIMVGIASAATHAYCSTGIPMLRNQNIKPNKLDSDDLLFINKQYEQTFKNKRLKKGDLLTARTGYPGTTCIIPDEFENAQSFTTLITRPTKKINSLFLSIFMNSEIGISFFERNQIGGGQKNINAATLKTFIVATPSLQEQAAIANVFSDTDALITQLEKLIAKKLAIKTATMQQLLTGRTRLPQFAKQPSGAIKNYKSSELGIIPDDWETVAMGEMGVTYGGLSGKSKNDFGSGNSLYVPFTNIMANVIVNVNHLERVNVQETQRQVLPGDLLFNGSSETPEEVCFCSLMSEEIDKLYLNSFCFGFRANSQPKYLPLYIAYWFRSSAGRTAVSIMAQGSTRYNISKSQFLTLKIVLPPILEQTAIATVLSDMDAELEKLEQKLAKIRDIKQGMMQQLLTGRIRLPLDHQP